MPDHNLPASDFIVRSARADDLTALCIVELKAIKDEKRLHPFTMSLSELNNIWNMRFKSGQFDILVAVDATNQERIIGFIALQAKHYNEAFIQAIYVDPLYYRKGVGTLLMQSGERICHIRKCPKLRLHVEPLNENGLSFYKNSALVSPTTSFII